MTHLERNEFLKRQDVPRKFKHFERKKIFFVIENQRLCKWKQQNVILRQWIQHVELQQHQREHLQRPEAGQVTKVPAEKNLQAHSEDATG